MARETRISPDGDEVAIRSDNDVDGNEAWGVFNAIRGGRWSSSADVEDWTVMGS